MTYELEFIREAKKEWDKLDNSVKKSFKKVLERRLLEPIVLKDRLSNTGNDECYKIKLKSLGFRLVYKVEKDKLILLVISVGKRENDTVYDDISERLENL